MRDMLIGIVVIALFTLTALSGELTGQEIIAKAFSLYRLAPYEVEEIDVTVTTESSRVDTKSFTRWIHFDPAGEDRVLIRFREPAMDKGLGLLIWRHTDAADEQWLKLPSMDRSRKVAIADQSKYFGGMDLTFEDARRLINERVQDFDYTLLQQNADGWIIAAVPKAGVKSGYGKVVSYIRPDFVRTQIDYYDSGGKLVKKQLHQNIVVEASGLWRTDRIVVENYQLKRTTELVVTKRQLDAQLSDGTFSQNELNRK